MSKELTYVALAMRHEPLFHNFLSLPRLRGAHNRIQGAVAPHRMIEIGEVGIRFPACAYRFGKFDPHLTDIVFRTVAYAFRHPLESLGYRQLLQ